jgi:predicted enzyme related to lactoylglutathione lyase
MKQNMVAWFEIPVSNMDRAKAFYEKVFEVKINVQDFGGVQMGWFPTAGEAPGALGSLIQNEAYILSEKGTLVYFGSENVQNQLDLIEEAGGKIKQGKTMISPEHGYMAVFIDTEGNRVALYSQG